MAMIRVTSAKLRSAAENLQGLNGQFRNKMQELTEQEQSLQAMWEGQAKETFHTAFLHDGQQMESFHALIEKYIQTLLEMAARYEQAEARNVEIAGTRNY